MTKTTPLISGKVSLRLYRPLRKRPTATYLLSWIQCFGGPLCPSSLSMFYGCTPVLIYVCILTLAVHQDGPKHRFGGYKFPIVVSQIGTNHECLTDAVKKVISRVAEYLEVETHEVTYPSLLTNLTTLCDHLPDWSVYDTLPYLLSLRFFLPWNALPQYKQLDTVLPEAEHVQPPIQEESYSWFGLTSQNAFPDRTCPIRALDIRVAHT